MSWPSDKQIHEEWLGFVRSLGPEIDPRAIRLMDEMRNVSRAIHQVGEQSLDGVGLSLAQYKVLMHLFFGEQGNDRGDLNPSQISERLGVSRNTISTLVRFLENQGLVARRLDPQDRRRFDISLTDSGRALVTEHARRHLLVIGSCFSVLGQDEQETLSVLLHKVGEHVDAVRAQGLERDLPANGTRVGAC